MSLYNWPEEIEKRKLVVVEGADDKGFFIEFLDKIGARDSFVGCVEGKNNFNNDLPLLAKRPGFSEITHLALIRDRNGDDAFDSVVNILNEKIGFFNVPSRPGKFSEGHPQIGIFIMPGEIEGCMLEDLCLKMVEDHPAMKCVDEFSACISQLENPPRNKTNILKARVQAYLAAQPEVANTIGVGANKGYWNLDSPYLIELKQFLDNLR
jgi:uncharacterized protein DUF3226